ncbi:hypothetical protein B566_EDAN005454 [Ephemera danica]|nr:hypothetical protein B566_EDAN005454 [Ephemera danica]
MYPVPKNVHWQWKYKHVFDLCKISAIDQQRRIDLQVSLQYE